MIRSNEERVKENIQAIAVAATELLPLKCEVTSLSMTETAKIIIASLNKEKGILHTIWDLPGAACSMYGHTVTLCMDLNLEAVSDHWFG